MIKILVANIFSAVEVILMALSMCQKEKKKIFFLQIIKCPLSVFASLLLGGYTSIITSINACI